MPRNLFALIFTPTPPAVDVVRQDDVTGDFSVGATVTFKCYMGKEKKQDVFETLEGEIWETVLRKDLVARLIGPTKVLVHSKEDAVQARRQEVEKDRLRQANLQAMNLHDVANQILSNGAGSLSAIGVSRKIQPNRVPKKLTAPEEEALRKDLANLSCLQPGPFKIELLKDAKVYSNAAKLTQLRERYSTQPKVFYRKVMTHILTEPILQWNGLSAQGKRGCVEVPVRDVVLSYTLAVYRSAKGNPNGVGFDPIEQLTNLISNCRRAVSEKKESKDGENETTNSLAPIPEEQRSFEESRYAELSSHEDSSFNSSAESSHSSSMDVGSDFSGSMSVFNVATYVGNDAFQQSLGPNQQYTSLY